MTIPRLPSRALTIFAVALALSAAALAQEKEPFTEERFAALQDEGALVLLDVSAEWCPTCHHQADVLADYLDANPDVPLHILTIDFDRQKPLVRRFGAPRQSTLILFDGDERVWFSVAETRRDVIFAALDEATGAHASAR